MLNFNSLKLKILLEMQSTQGYRKLELKIWWVEMRALERAITKTPFTFWPKLGKSGPKHGCDY